MRLEKETKALGSGFRLQGGGQIMGTVLNSEVTRSYPFKRSHLPELGVVWFAVMAESLIGVVSTCDSRHCLCKIPGICRYEK